MRVIIMRKIKIQTSCSRTKYSLELLTAVRDMDIAFESDIAEGAELVHHQLLHGKLVDNLLFHRTLGREFLDVEVDIEVFLLLEVVDTALGLDGQPLVGGMHLDIPEEEGRVIAAEEYRQFQGHLEVLQHLCKGARDILQERLAVDERRLERELTALFLARQNHVGRIEVEDGVLMLQHNVAQMGILLRGAHREVEVLHIEARQRIFRHKAFHHRVQGILRQIVDHQVHIGDDIQMAHVEPSALGLVRVLARLMVIGFELQATDFQVMLPVILLIVDFPDAERGCLRTFLCLHFPLALQRFQLSLSAKPAIVVLHLAECHLIIIILQIDGCQLRIFDIKRKGLLLLAFFLLVLILLLLRLVFLKGIYDKLIVGWSVLGFIEPRPHTLDFGFGNDERIRQQLHHVYIQRQLVKRQHLPVLQILYLKAFEIDILIEHVDARLVDLHLRLQLLLQLFCSDAQQLVLDCLRIQQYGSNDQ